jgi:hypothetical protein
MELESYTMGLILRALIRMPGPASGPVRVNRNRELARGCIREFNSQIRVYYSA